MDGEDDKFKLEGVVIVILFAVGQKNCFNIIYIC